MRNLFPVLGNGLFSDSALDSFFDGMMPSEDYVRVPKVDIEDKRDHYEVRADLPGFTKDQVHISYQNGILSLSAHKDSSQETKDSDHNYIRRERSSSDFRRQFSVRGIKEEGIKANLKDGVLTITLPKVDEAIEKAPRQITIE
jgi:HSP20 family protein